MKTSELRNVSLALAIIPWIFVGLSILQCPGFGWGSTTSGLAGLLFISGPPLSFILGTIALLRDKTQKPAWIVCAISFGAWAFLFLTNL